MFLTRIRDGICYAGLFTTHSLLIQACLGHLCLIQKEWKSGSSQCLVNIQSETTEERQWYLCPGTMLMDLERQGFALLFCLAKWSQIFPNKRSFHYTWRATADIHKVSFLWLRSKPCLLHVSLKTDMFGEGRDEGRKEGRPWEHGHIKKKKRKKERKKGKKTSINYLPVMLSWLTLASCPYRFQLRTQQKIGLAIFPAINIRSKQTQEMNHFGVISISLSWNIYE